MRTIRVATALATGSTLLLLGTAGYAAHPKWSLTCDSEKKCVYLSDGNGMAGGYPVAVDIDSLEISVKPVGDDNKCVWQWRLIGGVWNWVCVLTPVAPPAK